MNLTVTFSLLLQMADTLSDSGTSEAMVDGLHSDGGKSRIFCCAAWLGLSTHHAEERGLLLIPLHR